MSLSRARRFVFAGVLAAMALGLVFVCAEILLRFQERLFVQQLESKDERGGVVHSDIPGLNYTLRPGAREGEVLFNSWGLNMPEKSLEKSPRRKRLVFVGDSVTQGVGADRTGDAYPNQVDLLLASNGTWEAWNCGVGGYNADQILLYVRHILPRFQPDAVVYGFNFNDYWDPNQYFYGQAAIPPSNPGATARTGLLDQLKKLRTVLKLRDLYADLAYRVRGYPPSYVDQKMAYPSWQHMKTVIVDIRNEAAAAGLPFAVVVFPNEQFLFRDDAKNLAHRDLMAWLEQNHIAHLDLLPLFRPHREKPIYLRDGNHLTSSGYQLAAQYIAAWLSGPGSILATAPDGMVKP